MSLLQLQMLRPVRARLQVAGGIPPAFLYPPSCQGNRLSELSIFVDESGEWDKLSEYYLITLVFHVQLDAPAACIELAASASPAITTRDPVGTRSVISGN